MKGLLIHSIESNFIDSSFPERHEAYQIWSSSMRLLTQLSFIVCAEWTLIRNKQAASRVPSGF
jgi:hypothetical protein